MTRTLREWCFSFILIGILVITAILLMPFFGPQPGSNPIAVGIILAVMIISCLLLTFNRYISSYFGARAHDKKQITLFCPRCNIQIDKELGICPQCGNKL